MALFDKLENTMGKMKQDKVTSEIIAKKSMLEKSAGQEIGLLRNKINEQFCKLGEFAYSRLSKSESESVTTETAAEFLSEIARLLSEIKAREDKLAELLRRCDDELEMLNPAAPSSDTAKCSKCGNGYVAGIDMFCKNCGNKLD